MRLGAGQGVGSRLRGSTTAIRWNAVAKVVALVVVCHILAVVVLSAQSTAAGGPLVLFPLAALWRRTEGREQVLFVPTYVMFAPSKHRSWGSV